MLHLNLIQSISTMGIGDWVLYYEVNGHKVSKMTYEICEWWNYMETFHPYITLAILGCMVLSAVLLVCYIADELENLVIQKELCARKRNELINRIENDGLKEKS